MHTNYQLREIADLLRYSAKFPEYCSTKTKLRVYYQYGKFYIALNCSHYNRIMIKRLRHYLDKGAFTQRATSEVFDKVAQSCAIIFCFAQLTFPSSSSHFD
ncbi:hypothetical protein T11_18461 [Trichinella zimbabwensis]|uniref:Uncharacterized protein n=1 Tax=Trichinella zimbabwensis TaxID=268475 RepID=A0A0V1GPM9_9BILA|nr:hypothetical protein T11_18461 [Trichinella zimbabwensis]